MAWVSERDLEDKFVKSFVNSPSASDVVSVSVDLIWETFFVWWAKFVDLLILATDAAQ